MAVSDNMLVVLVSIISCLNLVKANYECAMNIMSAQKCNDMHSCKERNQQVWNQCSFCVISDRIKSGEHHYLMSAAYNCSLHTYTEGIYLKSKYWFGMESLSQTEAAEVCAADEAHLIYIETYNELQALSNFAQLGYWKPEDIKNYWTGAFRDESLPGKEYYWTKGNEVDYDRALWLGDEPSKTRSELCVRLVHMEVDGTQFFQLADYGCNARYGYICEINI